MGGWVVVIIENIAISASSLGWAWQKVKYDINTKGKHGISRETRFLGFYCQPKEVRYKH